MELSGTPFFAQTEYFCGPAALATVLNHTGVPVDPRTVAERVYLPERRGSLQIELVAAARSQRRMPYRIDGRLSTLLAEIRSGRPVLVLQNLGTGWIPLWHYAVVVGYNANDDVIYLRSGRERRKVMTAKDFMATWRRAGRWGIVVLEPGAMPADPQVNRFLAAAAAMEDTSPPAESRQWFQAAVERWPDDSLAWFALGNALYREDLPRPAVRAFREALARDPGLGAARNNLAHVLLELGCTDQALAEVNQALQEGGGEDAGLRRTVEQTRSEIENRLNKRVSGACRL